MTAVALAVAEGRGALNELLTRWISRRRVPAAIESVPFSQPRLTTNLAQMLVAFMPPTTLARGRSDVRLALSELPRGA